MGLSQLRRRLGHGEPKSARQKGAGRTPGKLNESDRRGGERLVLTKNFPL